MSARCLHEGRVPRDVEKRAIELDRRGDVAHAEKVHAALCLQCAATGGIGDRRRHLQQEPVGLVGALGRVQDGRSQSVGNGGPLDVVGGERKGGPEHALDVGGTPVDVERLGEQDGSFEEAAGLPGRFCQLDREAVVLVAVGHLRRLQHDVRAGATAVEAPYGHAQHVGGPWGAQCLGHVGEGPAQAAAMNPRQVRPDDLAVKRMGEADLWAVMAGGGIQEALLLEALDHVLRRQLGQRLQLQRLSEGDELKRFPLGSRQPAAALVDEVAQSG